MCSPRSLLPRIRDSSEGKDSNKFFKASLHHKKKVSIGDENNIDDLLSSNKIQRPN